MYRGGVRIAGTVIGCDAAAAGADLVFLSHAPVSGPRADARLRVDGRRRLLATDATLGALGPRGARLRAHALVAPYGRPFQLGDVRLELFPSAFMPGAASLLCERDGRRVVYAGPLGAGATVRSADALGVDARFACVGVTWPAPAAAIADVRARVREALAGGATPIVLVDPADIALSVADALSEDGIVVRAPRAIVDDAAARGQPAGLRRFSGRLSAREALLWPAAVRPPRRSLAGRARSVVFVSPRAGDAALVERLGAASAVVFPTGLDFAGLVRYVEATGASEVALLDAVGDDLPRALRDRGVDAYALGPPRQIDLFAAPAENAIARGQALSLRGSAS